MPNTRPSAVGEVLAAKGKRTGQGVRENPGLELRQRYRALREPEDDEQPAFDLHFAVGTLLAQENFAEVERVLSRLENELAKPIEEHAGGSAAAAPKVETPREEAPVSVGKTSDSAEAPATPAAASGPAAASVAPTVDKDDEADEAETPGPTAAPASPAAAASGPAAGSIAPAAGEADTAEAVRLLNAATAAIERILHALPSALAPGRGPALAPGAAEEE